MLQVPRVLRTAVTPAKHCGHASIGIARPTSGFSPSEPSLREVHTRSTRTSLECISVHCRLENYMYFINSLLPFCFKPFLVLIMSTFIVCACESVTFTMLMSSVCGFLTFSCSHLLSVDLSSSSSLLMSEALVCAAGASGRHLDSALPCHRSSCLPPDVRSEWCVVAWYSHRHILKPRLLLCYFIIRFL